MLFLKLHTITHARVWYFYKCTGTQINTLWDFFFAKRGGGGSTTAHVYVCYAFFTTLRTDETTPSGPWSVFMQVSCLAICAPLCPPYICADVCVFARVSKRASVHCARASLYVRAGSNSINIKVSRHQTISVSNIQSID